MSNMQRLAEEGNKNHKLFASTVTDLKNSQGFYGRLFRTVNDLSADGYDTLYKQLAQQNFNDSVDVILWLEQ